LKNKTAKILIITAVILLLVIIFNTQEVTAYGTIKGNILIANFETEVINCELDKRNLSITNPLLVNGLFNNKTTIRGTTTFNILTIISVNNTYNPKIDCYAVHEQDIIPQTLNYEITKNTPTIIEYNITNNQNMRLIYKCEMNVNCSLTRSYFTNYLSPGQTEMVYFEITCSEGTHNATVETLFVDELDNKHSKIDNLIINAI